MNISSGVNRKCSLISRYSADSWTVPVVNVDQYVGPRNKEKFRNLQTPWICEIFLFYSISYMNLGPTVVTIARMHHTTWGWGVVGLGLSHGTGCSGVINGLIDPVSWLRKVQCCTIWIEGWNIIDQRVSLIYTSVGWVLLLHWPPPRRICLLQLLTHNKGCGTLSMGIVPISK